MSGPVEFVAFTQKQISEGLAELANDERYLKKLRQQIGSRGTLKQQIRRLATQNPIPAKYLGIELDRARAPRFSFADTARIRLNPHSMDAKGRGSLKLSEHAKAMRRELPAVASILAENDRFGPLLTTAIQTDDFERSGFAKELEPALQLLMDLTGVPPDISLQVLKKGAYAYGRSHRPGMSRFGWARARLSSFLFKGCTYFSPDHLLVAKAVDPKHNRSGAAKARQWWAKHTKCLCRKPAQCSRPGKTVAADSVQRPRARKSRARAPAQPRVRKSRARATARRRIVGVQRP